MYMTKRDDDNLPVAAGNNDDNEQTRYEQFVEGWEELPTVGQAAFMFAAAMFVIILLSTFSPDPANNQRVSANTVITDVGSEGGDIELTIYTENTQDITIRHNGDNVHRQIGDAKADEYGTVLEERGDMETVTFDAQGQVMVCDESACEEVQT